VHDNVNRSVVAENDLKRHARSSVVASLNIHYRKYMPFH